MMITPEYKSMLPWHCPGNLWRELWETAKPLPAVRQTPLFDEDLAVWVEFFWYFFFLIVFEKKKGNIIWQALLWMACFCRESILNVFESISPFDLFRQLFVSIVSFRSYSYLWFLFYMSFIISLGMKCMNSCVQTIILLVPLVGRNVAKRERYFESFLMQSKDFSPAESFRFL